MHRETLEQHLNTFLEIDKCNKDFCPNGLQVQGTDEVNKIAVGVTASLEFIESAVEQNCDTLIVHHGIFWNYQPRTIRGMIQKRIKVLIENGINLFAYHLPLDRHPLIGNNAALLNHLGYPIYGFMGADNGIAISEFDKPMTLTNMLGQIAVKLTREPFIAGAEVTDDHLINNIAVCTGGAGIYFESVIEAGYDAFLTGEISEQHWNMAKESGVVYIAAGHTATETYGPLALGKYLHQTFPDLSDVVFIRDSNLV